MTVKRLRHEHVPRHKCWAKEDRQAIDYSFLNLLDLVRQALEDGRCPYCRDSLTCGNFSLDHARPRSRGGRHCLNNLTVCCELCNQRKGQLTDDEFRTLLATLTGFEPQGQSSVLQRLRSAGRLMRRA